MKKNLFLFLFLFFLVPVAACANDISVEEPLVIVCGEQQHVFRVEVAQTQEEQAKGLMNRTEMPEDAGMLFYFGDEKIRAFWMKDTLIPLDMIFLSSDGRITQIYHMAVPHDETNIVSVEPAFAVLEINGGVSAKLGLQIGDVIHHKVLGNPLAQ